MLTAEKIKQHANALGFSLVGALPAAEVRQWLREDVQRLIEWQESGHAGELQYMLRDPELFADPERFLPGARTILLFAVSYFSSNPQVGEVPPGFGRVARYAWGRDYHRVLKKALTKLMKELGVGGTHRIFADAVPFLERAIARRAALGFIGKNTLLITPGTGSFTFIAEIFTTLEVERFEGERTLSSKCGTCVRCQVACPTQAFTRPYSLDARRCISYLTIEKKTSFTTWEAQALGSWIFGCDVCQEVCPFNHRGIGDSTLEAFSANRGAGALLSLERVLLHTRASFAEEFSGTALMRAGRDCLVRNAICVVGNTKALSLLPIVRGLAETDSSEVVRSQARETLADLVSIVDGFEKGRILALLERNKPQNLN